MKFDMLKKLSLVLLLVLSCLSLRAQGTNIYSKLSPKLKQFLAAHPGASISLSNALSEAFSNRSVQLYYFYTDNESVPRSSHYYLNESLVMIGIRENQQPSDQYLLLIYEILNSEGEKRFNELKEEARSGNISRADFALGIIRQEYEAAKKIKKLLPDFKLSKAEIAESSDYEGFMTCPETFEAFLKESTSAVSNYERAYDSLRGTQRGSNTVLKPKAAASSVSTNK